MKFRAGWSEIATRSVRMAKLGRRLRRRRGALHPRTSHQGYRVKADWTRIAEVKAPSRSRHREWRHHFRDAVSMVAGEPAVTRHDRNAASSSNPWILLQIDEYVLTGSYFTLPESAR